jgi:hypothetical protein
VHITHPFYTDERRAGLETTRSQFACQILLYSSIEPVEGQEGRGPIIASPPSNIEM